jgi:hypothetical protein
VVTVSSVAVNPTSVTGGTASQGTVTLSAAPTAAANVTLTSDNAAATVPGSVSVNAGTASATFNVTTTAVTASIPVSIAASLNGTSQSATLTVMPPAPPPFAANLRVVSLSQAKRLQGGVLVDVPGRPAGSLNTCPLVQDGAGQRLDCELDASASTSPNGIQNYRYKWRLATVDGDSGNTTNPRHRPAVQNCGFFGGQPGSQFLNMRVTLEISSSTGATTSVAVEGVSVFPAGLCGYAF